MLNYGINVSFCDYPYLLLGKAELLFNCVSVLKDFWEIQLLGGVGERERLMPTAFRKIKNIVYSVNSCSF